MEKTNKYLKASAGKRAEMFLRKYHSFDTTEKLKLMFYTIFFARNF